MTPRRRLSRATAAEAEGVPAPPSLQAVARRKHAGPCQYCQWFGLACLCAYLVGSRGWQSRYWAAACRETLFHRALCAHPEEADLDAVLDYGLDFCGDDAHARGGDHGEGGVAPERAPVHRRAEPVVFLLVARVQAHIEEEHAARHEPRRHPRDDPGLLAGRHVEYRIEGRDEVERLRWELDARHVASQELHPRHVLARHLDAARRDVDR